MEKTKAEVAARDDLAVALLIALNYIPDKPVQKKMEVLAVARGK